MATDVTMPRLSDSMEEGTILKWIVEEGGEVKRGEPLVEIETDKANMTYEADTSGTLIEVVAKEGDTLPIGEVIARIGEEGEKPSKDSEDREEEETVTESEEKPEPARAAGGDGRKGSRRGPGALAAAADGLPPDGGVEGHGARLHPPLGRGHEPVR